MQSAFFVSVFEKTDLHESRATPLCTVYTTSGCQASLRNNKSDRRDLRRYIIPHVKQTRNQGKTPPIFTILFGSEHVVNAVYLICRQVQLGSPQLRNCPFRKTRVMSFSLYRVSFLSTISELVNRIS